MFVVFGSWRWWRCSTGLDWRRRVADEHAALFPARVDVSPALEGRDPALLRHALARSRPPFVHMQDSQISRGLNGIPSSISCPNISMHPSGGGIGVPEKLVNLDVILVLRSKISKKVIVHFQDPTSELS